MASFSSDKIISRREQILEAAFSIAHRNFSWSLQDVAWEVGVSKPALYRHYANRADLEQVMETRVMEYLLAAINGTEENTDSIRSAIVDAFRKKPDYYMFLARNLVTVESFSDKALDYLKINSSRINAFFTRMDNTIPDIQLKKSLGIQKNAITVLLASYCCPGIQEYQDELLRRNSEGFPELVIPDDSRLDTLENLPVPFKPGKNEKLFEAIARAVQNQGIGNVTIEKIAAELGTAKSSLYFYYDNKQSMLSDLILHESETVLNILARHVQSGKSFEEQLYLAMLAHVHYLLNKPEIIPVFNWIRYEMITRSHEVMHPDSQRQLMLEAFDSNRIITPCSDAKLGFLSIIKWVLIISSGCTIREYERGLSKEDVLKSIRTMYKLILIGDKELV